MLKALICITIVILLVVCQSYGLRCKNGQTNYTTTHYTDKYEIAYVTIEKLTPYKTCYYPWLCLLKSRTRTEQITKQIVTVQKYKMINCCPGFVNDSNACRPGCEEGLYGTKCTQNCTWCPSHCDIDSGNCTCEPGYTGDNCTQECTNNTYGLFCNETCMCNENQTCDHVNGSCICKSGWHGENCSEECDAMTFGVDCLKNCTCDRSNTQTCDRETGYCHCKPGYENKDCDSECTAGTFGPNCIWLCNCNNSLNDSCNNTSGQCVCDSGWTGRTCDKDTNQCQSNPCLNNGICVDGDRSYTCNCTERWSGINCEIDKESCLYQRCKNNGECVKAINGFVCKCHQGYEGYRCQNEIVDQTTIIVVLTSAICALSIVLATVCCYSRYRREHKKTKTDASNVLGKEGLKNSKEVQTEMEEGHYNENVYDEIKENTVADHADYIHPVNDVELPRDADGYVKFADNDQSVGYYKLKHTKTENNSKLSGQKF